MFGASNEEPISRQAILTILELMLGEDIAEDQVISIAERIIFEADKAGDGKISFEEFCSALERTDVKHKMSISYLS
jgi:Ca2+-binding EF-hand superfamily protein